MVKNFTYYFICKYDPGCSTEQTQADPDQGLHMSIKGYLKMCSSKTRKMAPITYPCYINI